MKLPTLAVLLILGSAAARGADVAPNPGLRWTTLYQTGLADTFQLTLGGTFGRGPAWQSRVETGLANLWKPGDALYLYGAESLDLDVLRSNWQTGVEYRRPLWKRGRHQLTGSAGVQHWRFALVKSGTSDWLSHESLTYRCGAGRNALLATSDAWNLYSSPLPNGSLLHTQVWVERVLRKRESLTIAFRHGPAHTYSWGFYGTNGNRVFRYQTMLVLTIRGATRIEGGYRKQFGLQDGIRNNGFWQFCLTRSFIR